jgi:hypothetical protein
MPPALSTASMYCRTCASGSTPVKPSTSWPPTTAITIGMPCTRSAWASRGLASTSTLPSTQLPPPSAASFSSTGESCLHGSHHSAQKSRMTGVATDRSRTADWKFASVTSMTTGGAPPGYGSAAGVAAGPAGLVGAGLLAGRSAPRSTAPRVKIDGVVRGSLMVT